MPMWKNRYLMMALIIFLTIAAIVISQRLGGQDGEMTMIGVAGVIITIFQWFIPIGPGRHSSPDLNVRNDEDDPSQGFRGDTFTRH